MAPWLAYPVRWTGLSADTLLKIAETFVSIAIVLILRAIAVRAVRERITDVKRAYSWHRGISYASGVVALLLIGRTWFVGLQLGTFLGLLSAGLAIALSDSLASFAGWLFIIARRPFKVGDRIQIGEHVGDVIDVRLFQTLLLECGKWVDSDQSTGRVLLIPNGMVFKHITANYTRGFDYIWDEIQVVVTFESDWRRAKEILSEIGKTHAQPLTAEAEERLRLAARDNMIFFQNLTPIVYTSVKDHGVQLALRYLTKVRARRSSAERVWEALLDALAKEDRIDLAYPTTRHYLNHLEGKPGARATPPTEAP
jgi:small-conductance mechanosensitive channel